ncbi:hypothetical protein Droror1_Dr00016720 [Drosera rotundifolia]
MEAAGDAMRYWCHMCSQVVNPILEEELKCPFCHSGFVEEMGSAGSDGVIAPDESDLASDRALSLWAPILLGMMGNRRRRRRFRRDLIGDNDEGEDDGDVDDNVRENPRERGMMHPRLGDGIEMSELDRELDSIVTRRRRRSSAAILQLLQGIRAGIATEVPPGSGGNAGDRDQERERERERLILINPFNQTIIVQGSGSYDDDQNQSSLGSLSDYIVGPGLDMLLQHLAENDPNRYGTPPTQKQVIESLPVVKVDNNMQCAVCLDDFEPGAEAKEIPCKHKFHEKCILPWLEMHSSCPVCRHQLPTEDSKPESDGSRGGNNSGEASSGNGRGEGAAEMGERSGSDNRFGLPWPLSTIFSSGTESTVRVSSRTRSSSSGSSTTGGAGTASQTDEE